MSTNIVPKTYDNLVQLAVKARAGAGALGGSIELLHHTHARITADLFDLTGNPAHPEMPGKQAALNAQKQALKAAYETDRSATAAGQEFCRVGIGLLKTVLGNSYNVDWHNAGFLTPTLRVPRNPMTMLIQFRQYLAANPNHENPTAGITAEWAHALFSAIESSNLAVSAAKTALIAAKRARDLALRALKKRMSGLRAELEQILSPDDGRWLEFGFRVPAGGTIPEKVEVVSVFPGTTGTAVVKWESTRLAESYRVTWRPSSQPAGSETEVGRFTDKQALITGLPIGESIFVGISARNRSGETALTEVHYPAPKSNSASIFTGVPAVEIAPSGAFAT